MNSYSNNYSLLATRYSLRFATTLHLALFVLVVVGILPRGVVPFWALALCAWAAVVSPKQSVLFFAVAIPTFVAIPITADFDNFNTWRIVALVIFLRWFFSTQSWRSLINTAREFLRHPLHYRVASLLIGLAVLALLSVTQAGDKNIALLRIIYFLNAALVPIVAYALTRTDPNWRLRLMKAMAWSAVLVTTVAFIQLTCTYLMDVYAFMRIWGEEIQLKQFGTQWSNIAVYKGNTWLAYYGPQLSLRVFSLFTDSHSFPMYLLMAMGGLVAFSLQPVAQRLAQGATKLTELLKTRARMAVLGVPFGLLAIILSGTRGIWAASIGLPLVFLAVAWWLKRFYEVEPRRLWWRYLGAFISMYYLLFALAWPIFISPQFLLSKGDWGLLRNRVRSIVDFGETSNAQRLEIWRASLDSIRERPLLGVGIGNFPTVLDQHVTLARAGSSAHNIWLHVAAEMGLPALALFVGVWLALIASCLRIFIRDQHWTVATWAGWMLFVVPWIAAYLLTDAALFDERALLMFGLILALARGGDEYRVAGSRSGEVLPEPSGGERREGFGDTLLCSIPMEWGANGGQSPPVSIFMAVHNGASWIGDVLDSVAAQTYPNIEVTVWDNASTDATQSILKNYKAKVISSSENVGFWAVMEKLIAQSDAPYIVCLTDVVLHPEFVSQAVSALEKDPSVGAVQGKIYEQHRATDGSWVRSDYIDALGFRLQRSRRVTILGHGERDTGQYAAVQEVFGVEGAVPVFRRTALNDCMVDGFCTTDPAYRVGGITYADDLDLAWRMTLMGWRQVMVPTAVGWHDRSTTKSTGRTVTEKVRRRTMRAAIPASKRRLDWSNARFSIIKNDSILNILRDLPRILVREIAVQGYFLLFERDVLAEWGRFLRLLPLMLRRRHTVQARARLSAAQFRRFIT